MTLWLTLNSLAIIALAGVTYLVLRQLGFVLQRTGPLAARGTDEGPRLGENIAAHFGPAGLDNGKSKLLVFMSEHCGVCGLVRKGAEELARSWHPDAEIYLIYDCAEGEDSRLEVLAKGLHYQKDAKLRQQLGANFVPFALVTDRVGVVVSKGLVNDSAHLESLLEVEKAERRKLVANVAAGATGGELTTTISQT